jgi:ferredoxin
MIHYETAATLVCRCGERGTFSGADATAATELARFAGWHACGQSAVCPTCLAKMTTKIHAPATTTAPGKDRL